MNATQGNAGQTHKTYEFYAGMTCDGCKNAVTRVVKGIPGVDKLDVDVAARRVLVSTRNPDVTPDVILEKLSKWAKASNKEVRYVKAQ